MGTRRPGGGHMIYIVGIPKSGTHALQKAVRELGCDASDHLHTGNYHLAETNKVAYVLRNPRNVLLSSIRYRNHQMRGWEDTITEEKWIDGFFNFFNTPLPGVYYGYAKWLTSKAHIVRFESLMDRSAIPALAAFCEVSVKPIALEGGTPTWTGELSDWRKYWTEGIDRVWREEGMEVVERGLGYAND